MSVENPSYSRLKRPHNVDLGNRIPGALGIGVNINIPLLPPIGVTLLPNLPNAGNPTTPANTPQSTPTPIPNPTLTSMSAPQPQAPAPETSSPTSGSGSSNGGGSGGGSGAQVPAPSSSQGGSSGNQSPSTPGSSTPVDGGSPSPSVSGSAGSVAGSGNTPSNQGSTSATTNSSPSNQGSTAGTTGNPTAGGPSTSGGSNLDSSFPTGQGGSTTSTSSSNSGSDTSPIANAGRLQSGSRLSGTSSLKGSSSSVTRSGASPSSTDGGNGIIGSNSTSGGLSKGGGIAIGITCAILFLLGLVFVLRRHRKTRRDQHNQFWWFTTKPTSQSHNDDQAHMIQSPASLGGVQSNRSSFATTFDRSHFDTNFGGADLPALPPMAEVRRSRNDFEYPAHTPTTNLEFDNRFSLGSAGSRDSNFFIINHRPSLDTSNDHHHPCSPNPFAQRFAFPMPPSERDAPSERKSGYSSGSESRPVSDSGQSEAMRGFDAPDTSPTPPEHHNLPAFADNPFLDPDPFDSQSTVSHTTNPFTDSIISMIHDAGVELPLVAVLRAFLSSMPDEVSVQPGDHLKVLQIFDDGWALVDKIPHTAFADIAAQRGLVPLGCIR